jgi:hypothetical protein
MKERVLAISTSSTPPPTTPKGNTPMMNMTGYDGNHTKVEKTPVAGINASNDPVRLIEILERLELITPEFAKPLRTIAANGAAASLQHQNSSRGGCFCWKKPSRKLWKASIMSRSFRRWILSLLAEPRLCRGTQVRRYGQMSYYCDGS